MAADKKEENVITTLETTETESVKRKYKLKDPKAQYAERGFTLADDQEKTLPDNPSIQLLARIKAGFIEEVK